jgi:hypothetical protein
MYTDNEAHIQVQVPIYTMSSSSDVKKKKVNKKQKLDKSYTVKMYISTSKNSFEFLPYSKKYIYIKYY